jgi:hypothetical protein
MNAITNNAVMRDDMKVRLTRLLMAIEYSVFIDSTVSQANTPDVRIFVAPEFYFRPPAGPKADCGEYSYNEYVALRDFLLNEYFSRFREYHGYDLCNWLFLCGTCVYNATSNFPGVGKQLWNMMLAYTMDATGRAAMQPFRKLCTSHIDGIATAEDVNWVMQTQLCYLSEVEILEHYFPSFRVFVEICLETCHGLWRNVWQGGAVGAHVVSAAGMPLDGVQYKNGPNAVLIRNDGMLDNFLNMVATVFEEQYSAIPVPGLYFFPFEWQGNNLWEIAAEMQRTVERNDLRNQILPVIITAI